MENSFTFGGCEYRLGIARYLSTGYLAVDLLYADGYYFCAVSVNIEVRFLRLAGDEFYLDVKELSKEMIDAFVERGVFTITDKHVIYNFGRYPLCRLSKDWYDYLLSSGSSE